MATTEQRPAAMAETNGTASDQNEVINPATGEVVGTVPDLTPDEIREVVAKARAAQPGWEALGFEGRGRILLRAQKWVMDNSTRIIETIVSETGKTYEDAQLAEVSYAANAFGFWAKNAPEFLADEKIKSSSLFVKGKKLLTRYAPAGVVGVIGPWNFPLTNSFGDCIPALAAGNTVILKPAEKTPLTSILMLEMLQDCGIPEDVFQVATGKGSVVGPPLIDGCDVIMFTGSTETGKRVMAQAAETITPVYLELGGKDPMIVLSDADVERAANAAAYYSMNNTGQVCISVERVYVEEPIYDDFVNRVADKVRNIRQGVPGGPAQVDVGSLTFPPQMDIVEAHVKDAVDKGAKVLVGGERPQQDGWWYPPTLVTDITEEMDVYLEEVFGPVALVFRASDIDDAVRIANATRFGLGSNAWTNDAEEQEVFIRDLAAGQTFINGMVTSFPSLPFGGVKASGHGRELAVHGIREFTNIKTVWVGKSPESSTATKTE